MYSQKESSPEKLDKIRQLQEQIKELEKLIQLFEDIFSAITVEEALKKILETTLDLCSADQGSIFLIDPQQTREAKTLLRESGNREEIVDHYLNNLLAGWISVHKQALMTNDLVKTFGEDNITPRYQSIRSALSLPLLQQENLIGVINLVSLQARQLFGERELRIGNILATRCTQFIQNARLRENLFKETLRLKQEIQDKYVLHGIIGHSPGIQEIFSLLERVIPTDVRVLLQGESGTGKERIARAIHYSGLRKEAPFVAVDCGALPANLLESELFGYVKGAFTGADKDRTGLFEEADGGTLFLDEIANMPLEIQSKFLRAIQEGEIRPLGTSRVRKVNVRIISAASGDLAEQVDAGEFRKDLYYRLNVVNISLPPLRERREDIAILANHFLQKMNRQYDKQIKGFKPQTISFLENYSWPGNIRELEHAVERAVVLCEEALLNPRDFSFLATSSPTGSDYLFQPRSLQEALQEFKREYIAKLLAHTDKNQRKAAEILQIQRTYLNRLIKELGINS